MKLSFLTLHLLQMTSAVKYWLNSKNYFSLLSVFFNIHRY